VSGSYRGDNWIFYYTTSATQFELDYTWYRFSPALARSTYNNQNIKFYGGSNYASYNSPDNLVRDGEEHVGLSYPDTLGDVTGNVGQSNIAFTDIFDVPNATDPRCTAQSRTF
jgi:hypothetical protein